MYREHAWLIALCGAWAALVSRFWFVCDDAFITWRYSKNLAEGQGVRFNLGPEAPVEGYSNFLWMIFAAGFERVGADLTVVMPLMSSACALVLLGWVWRSMQIHLDLPWWARVAGCSTLVFSMPFAVWSTSGLATMPFALLLFLFFERVVLCRDAPLWQVVPVGLALALVRTEGIAWAMVVVILAGAVGLQQAGERRRVLGRVLGALGMIGGAYALYYGWRYWHFGTLVSNTALVKVSFGQQTLMRGLQYITLCHLVFVVPLLGYFGTWPASRVYGSRGVAISLMGVALPAYAVVVGGDYMVAGRLLVPGLSFGALLTGVLIHRLGSVRPTGAGTLLAGTLGLGLLPVVGVQPLAPRVVHEALHIRLNTPRLRSEREQWDYMRKNAIRWRRQGEAIAQVAPEGASMEHSTIGAVGYYSGVYIYDRAGLVTREVAERDISGRPLRRSPGHDKTVPRYYFAKDNPTYLRAVRVTGRRYAGAMQRQVRGWGVTPSLKRRYVPDFTQIRSDGALPAFLLVLRLAGPEERPDAIWRGFADRAKNYELKNVEEEQET